MTLALTFISPTGRHDLRVPAHVAVLALEADLCAATGVDALVLTDAVGRPLDPERSLLDNGVLDGAILQAAPNAEPAVYDDVVDLARTDADAGPPGTAAGPLSGAVAAALCAGGGYLLSLEPLRRVAELLVIVAVIGAGAVARATVRVARAGPHDDPAEPAVRRRLARAAASAGVTSTVVDSALVVAGTALAVLPDMMSASAGWCCLLLAVARCRPGDSVVTAVFTAGATVALVAAFAGGSGGWLLLGLSGVAGCLAVAAGRWAAPATRLAVGRAAVLLTAAIPALTIAGSGLLPGLP